MEVEKGPISAVFADDTLGALSGKGDYLGGIKKRGCHRGPPVLRLCPYYSRPLWKNKGLVVSDKPLNLGQSSQRGMHILIAGT